MNDKTSFSTSIKNSAFIKNPVLFESIGIAPVVAMAVSVKTAIMLSVISAAELIIIECFASIALKKVKHEYRVLIYALLGVLINVPFWLFFSKFAPNETANVSIFLPIIAVNSLIALHCERVAVRSTLKETFFDAVSATIGYVLIIFIVAILRYIVSLYVEPSLGFQINQKGSATDKNAKELYSLYYGAYAEIYITPLKNLEWYFEVDINNDNATASLSAVTFAGTTGITWYLPAL